MFPEKKIVNIWLNQNGFSVINNINAGKNRVIDTLAIKSSKQKPMVQHIEINCSVSMQPKSKRAIAKQFNNNEIEKEIKKFLKKHLGYTPKYQKVLVTTSTQKIKGIKIISFQKILFEVTNKLDMQNYQDPVIRTLQLIRHVLFEDPETLASLVWETKHPTKRQFLKTLLGNKETQTIMQKKYFESILLQILKESTLSKPEKLAKQLYKTYKKPSRKKFLREFINLEIPKEKPEYRSLQYYLKR
ncbi:MAG: hypothetical protein MAG795_00557 [Candidatus Woesearchaeota archaeon]|nr:hypothetical protein [Candidatus Woesearchaeota archaeon]